MELCKEYKQLEYNQAMQKCCESFDIEYQLNLPQYLEDMENLIKCEVNNAVSDYELSSNSIKLYVKSLISITYRSNSGCIFSTVFEEEFIKSITLGESEGYSFANVGINTKYYNYHIINQRRIDIHSCVSASIEPYCKSSIGILSRCENAFTKASQLEILVDKYSAVAKSDFDEVFSINDKSTPVKNIIDYSIDCCVEDCKLIKDKMLVKLNLSACVVYADESNSIQKCCHTFSISKIIEVSDCDVDDNVLVNARLSRIYIKPKADDNNILCDIELVGCVSVSYCIKSTQTIELITDSYIPHKSTTLTQGKLKHKVNPVYYCDDKSMELIFDNDNTIVEIVHLSCSLTNPVIHEASLSFTALLSYMYYDDNSQLCYYRKSQDCSILLSDAKLNGDASINLNSFDYVIKSSNKISVRLNLEYCAYLFEEKQISVVTDIEDQGEIECDDTCEMILYFAAKDENVWDIAKSFSTDSRLIIEENNLKSDVLDTAKVLLVPGM